jgi:recombination protein RecA
MITTEQEVMERVRKNNRRHEKELVGGVRGFVNIGVDNEEGTLYRPATKPAWRLPTGVASLDKLIGGGLPSGSIVQIYGNQMTGKTSLAYRICAQAVKAGYQTLLVPLEGYEEEFAKACGIDIDAPNFDYIAGNFAEEVFDFCTQGMNNNIEVIVLDSITAAVPKEHVDKKQKKGFGDTGQKVGAQAVAIQSFIYHVKVPLMRKQRLLVTINQLRSTINSYGGSSQPSGGKALGYFSDIMLNMYHPEGVDKKALALHEEVASNVTVRKGKRWGCHLHGTTTLYFKQNWGLEIERDLLLTAQQADIVSKSGAWLLYTSDSGKEYKLQGSSQFVDELRTNDELRNEISDKLSKVSLAITEDEQGGDAPPVEDNES